ncbi:hypothetical protein [Sphingobium nicotianae]|uniref:Uncharacterized protein n=1 Tax=Sphingobium nicotianae TaxID=2782607 RepID=A0A9X1IT57_9SPHN|nr:hypothetical protein [Sphingobium nicotianae]MBT2188982.1 hypothetical protein [Sphingobium nicotianae]
MSEVDDLIARSNALIARTSERYLSTSARGRAHKRQDLMARLKRMIIAAVLVVVGAAVFGFVQPLGSTGLLIVMGLLLACVLFAFVPTQGSVTLAKLGETDLKALPLKTEMWLESQRKALPAPAIPILDAISNRLETLAPQLATLSPQEPAALEVRRLLSDHLPELVTGYQSIPAPLRGQPRNGRVPDAQLVEGLSVIEQEIATMTEQLASGDLDKLAAHNRYLEIKYQEAKELGG